MAHLASTSSNTAILPTIVGQHGTGQNTTPVTSHAAIGQPHHGIVQTLQDWQGLEAGGLAIIAALIGAWALNRQTNQNRSIEADRLRRELRARRAILPLALSTLGEWADACGTVLYTAHAKARGVGISRNDLEPMPALPNDVVAQLERFVEASDDVGATSVANLVGDVQIFVSRMRGAGFLPGIGGGKNQVPSDLESHLLGIAAVAAHIGALFDYSRRRSNATPAHPTWDEVRASLRLIGADAETDPRLFARLDGRERTGKLPGYLGDDVSST